MQVIPNNTPTAGLRTIFFTLVDATDLFTPEDITVSGVAPTVKINGTAISGTAADIVKVNGTTGEYSWTATQTQVNSTAGFVLRGELQPTGCALTKFEAQIGPANAAADTVTANVVAVNDVEVIGDGTSGNRWRATGT